MADRARGAAAGLLAAAVLAGCSSPSPTPGPVQASTPSVQPLPPAPSPGPCAATVAPGASVQAAVDARPGGRICLAAGTFDLTRAITLGDGQSLTGTRGTVLRGSVRLAGWRRAGRTWTTTAALAPTDAQAQCEDLAARPCRVRNQVFVDGEHARLVPRGAPLRPGLAHVDPSTGRVEVAVDPAAHEVRLSTADRAVLATGSGVRVTDLAVTQFATGAQLGAVEVGRGARVERLEVSGVHGVGIKVTDGDDAVVAGNSVHDNGQLGIAVFHSRGAFVDGNTVRGNNTDGFWEVDWESGGIKATVSSLVVRDNTVEANRGVGIWVDLQCDGAVVTGNRVTGNLADGIRHEISSHGRVSDNQVSVNGWGRGRGTSRSVWAGGSITVNTSTDVVVSGNTLTGNANGPSLQLRRRGPGSALRGVVVAGNDVDLGAGRFGVVADSALAGEVDVAFRGNRYRGGGARPATWLGEDLTWAQWRAHEPDARVG